MSSRAIPITASNLVLSAASAVPVDVNDQDTGDLAAPIAAPVAVRPQHKTVTLQRTPKQQPPGSAPPSPGARSPGASPQGKTEAAGDHVLVARPADFCGGCFTSEMANRSPPRLNTRITSRIAFSRLGGLRGLGQVGEQATLDAGDG